MARVKIKTAGSADPNKYKNFNNDNTMSCKICNTKVANVSSTATAVTCHRCVAKSIDPSLIFIDRD